MLSNNGSALLGHAISKFSPDVFLHPVWVRFGKQEVSNLLKIVDNLFNAARRLQNDDPIGACQILLICAVYQNYAGQSLHAWTTIQNALSLARGSGLFEEILWALWGACAISFQQGNHEQAAKQLSDLQAELITQDEWVLANFVDVVKQNLLHPATNGTAERSGATLGKPVQDLLNFTFDWLQQWGYFVQFPKRGYFSTSRRPISLAFKRLYWSRPFFSIRFWKNCWYSLMRMFKNKTNRFSKNIPPSLTSTPVIHEQVSEIDGSVQPHKPSSEIPSMHPPSPIRQPIKKITLVSSPIKNERNSKQNPVSLVVYCLGSFQVFPNERLISSWDSLKSQCIFKYLTATEGKSVAKDILMELFWPEADLASARRNLHQAIYSLRQTLRSGHPNFAHIQFENNYYFFNPAMDIWCDFPEFEHKVNTGRRLESQGRLTEANVEYGIAESIYQGDFLEEDLYDEWPKAKREYLRVIYLEITEKLIHFHMSRSDYMSASVLCRKVLNRDNCQEQVHRLLIQCYLAQGQRHLALRQYQTCVETLRKELDIEPAITTTALYEEIRRSGLNNTRF